MQLTTSDIRCGVLADSPREHKAALGQFFTPVGISRFMAGLFPDASGDGLLLDAGAGSGSLSSAFVERWSEGGFHFSTLQVAAFEVDALLLPALHQNLSQLRSRTGVTANVHHEDFIVAAVESLAADLFAKPHQTYTHAILNPPYRKISSQSLHRKLLRRAGIETVNLYSAFISLALRLMAPGGQVVAIIPRSFCNGTYYRSFRNDLLSRAAIRHIHLFDSRSSAFRDDAVLQENVILRLEVGGAESDVVVSTSTDDQFHDFTDRTVPYSGVVYPSDADQFIHVPTSDQGTEQCGGLLKAGTLSDLGLNVSTGPVVDFRARDHLLPALEVNTVPLLYPAHFSNGRTIWPDSTSRKPSAIILDPTTASLMLPNGHYCVVRRLSSKEERRRIVASVVDPARFGTAALLGFENHLNVFHRGKQALSPVLAHGLAAYLSSSVVDTEFRRFSGHTQVNAADLRRLAYPSREVLCALGAWAMTQETLSETEIDEFLKDFVS